MWNQNIQPSHIVHPTKMMSWGAKWLEEPDVEWRGLKPDGHNRMVKRIWKLLDEADCVIHYNGKSFDVPRIQREFLKMGMPPPSPFKQIDLLLTVRKQFRFDSNKLEEVAKQLGIGRKVEHEGFGLWLKCLDGEMSAWERMKKYNVQDVRLTEQAYLTKLRPWVVSHPSVAAFRGEDVCPKCGSADRQRRGKTFLKTASYPRFMCKACKSWYRGTKRIGATGVAEVAA